MITKTDSLKKSERVFALVCEEVAESLNNDKYNLYGYLNAFNNCRETGLYLTAYFYEDIENKKSVYSDIFVWVYEHRNGDGICVIISKERPDLNGKFNDKAWRSAKCFDWDGEHRAADYIISTIVDMYEAELEKSRNKVGQEMNTYYCAYIAGMSYPVKCLKISANSEEEAKSKAKDYLHRVEGDSLKYISIVTPDDFYYYKAFQWRHGIEISVTEVE